MKRQQGSSILLLIIAVVLIGLGGGYLLKDKIPFIKTILDKKTVTAPVTSDNIIYKNAKWGYKIEYSKIFSFKEIFNGNGIVLIPTANLTGDNNDALSSANDAILITVYHKSGDEITSKTPLAEYAKNAAPQEIQNYESLASIETITTKSGDVGYITTWNRSGPRFNGVELNTKHEPSDPITYFDPADEPYYAVRIELRDAAYTKEYEEVIRSYSSK
jgi:hypothetical protein